MSVLITNFRSCERGSIALMFGLMLMVFLAVAGGAIDYGVGSRLDQDLEAAASASVLAAANEGRVAFLNGDVETEEELKTLIENSIEGRFEAKIGGLERVDSGTITPSVVVKDNEIRAHVDYSGSSPNSFLGLIGIDKMDVRGDSTAIVNLPKYYHISLVFDVSASMGIGATVADEQTIAGVTNCAFTCHIGDTPKKTSGHERAQAAGAVIRLDVARNAAMTAIDALEHVQETEDQVSFSVHTFDNIPYEVVGLNDASATDFDYVKSKINAAVHMNAEYGGTNIDLALSTVAAALPSSGTGLTADDRIHYVVVMTDGVQNAQAKLRHSGWFPHPEAVLNEPQRTFARHEILHALSGTDACSVLSRKNIVPYFLYVEYIHPTYGRISGHDQRRFGFIRDTLFDIVPTRFAECAGDAKRVIKATSADDINEAFEDILKALIAPLRLS
jgi:hypothetical protein